MVDQKTICVVGASGLVGSNLVRAGLARGYRVNATMRDAGAPEKAPYLNALPGAAENLTLFSAEMADSDAFDAPLAGCDAVFIASFVPIYFGPTGKPAREMDDEQGYTEIIKPTLDGCLNIMRAAARQGVQNVLICSSTSSTNPIPPVPIKNEVDHWSDETEQYRAKKYTSAGKTVMEKAALEFAAEHDMRLCIFMPTGMYGPVILPEHLSRRGPQGRIKTLIDGGAPMHQKTPNDSSSMIHLDDLAALFFAAYENPAASGRYYGVYESWPWQDIYAELQKLIPDMQMPEPLTEPAVPPTGFDFTRRDSLGVPLRDIPTMLRETVEWIKTDPFPAEAVR